MLRSLVHAQIQAFRLWGLRFRSLEVCRWGLNKLKLNDDHRTSFSLGLVFWDAFSLIMSFYDFYPFAPMTVDLDDRLAIMVRRFPSGVVDSRSLRSESYARIKEFVRRSTYVPFIYVDFRGMCVVSSCTAILWLFMERWVPTFVMPWRRVVQLLSPASLPRGVRLLLLFSFHLISSFDMNMIKLRTLQEGTIFSCLWSFLWYLFAWGQRWCSCLSFFPANLGMRAFHRFPYGWFTVHTTFFEL
jgi:hypothetical protein